MKLLLAEDQNLVREAIRSLLVKEPDVETVFEAADGPTAVRVAQELAPDVAILGVTMSRMNGLETARRIRSSAPHVKVMVLSVHCDRELVTEALKAGVSGYVLKSCAATDLMQAIRTVNANQTYLSPQVAELVKEAYLGRLPCSHGSGLNSLTPRQIEVLQLLAEGFSTKRIARRLGRSIKTVEMHRRHLMQKLQCEGVADLTKYAIRKGLTSLDPG